MSNFLFFSSESSPPAGSILSRIYAPIEAEFGRLSEGKLYTRNIDNLAVIFICIAKELTELPERKYVTFKRLYADFRLIIDFDEFVHSDKKRQFQMFTDCVKKAVDILSVRDSSFSKEEFLRDFDEAIAAAAQREKAHDALYNTVDERILFINRHCPDYIGGEEVERSRILLKLYEELPKGIDEEEKALLFDEKIRSAFHINGSDVPDWAEYPDWQMTSGGIPMRFVRQEEYEEKTDVIFYCTEYYFQDPDTGEINVIKQVR